MQVFMIAALSIDGFIAPISAPSSDQVSIKNQASTAWTSPADKKFFQQRTKRAKVVVMGSRTFRTIGRPLKDRLNIIYTRESQEDFLNSVKTQLNGEIDETILKEQLWVTQAKPVDLVDQVAAQGYQEMGICGGASIYSQFLEAGVVDKLYLTIEPIIFGQGLKLFNQRHLVKLRLLSQQKLGNEGTVLLEYQLR